MRDLGVLFVHGIGTQSQGRTLADWGQSVTAWINRWTSLVSPNDASPAITVRDAILSPADSSRPAHAFLDVSKVGSSGPQTSHWILAESWWAATVLPPSYGELVRWSMVVVPWTIASHFIARFQRKKSHQTGRLRFVPLAGNFVVMLAAMVAMPFILIGLGLVLVIGAIPIPQVRALAGAVQRGLANTLGDSQVLLDNAMQAAAIVGRVRHDLEWLSAECEKVVVVAHSQGAAVAHLALQQTRVSNVTLFLTFGSGIAKLLETRRLMAGSQRSRWAPWLLSSGAMLLFAGLWGSVPALWELRRIVFINGLAYVLLIGLAFVDKFPKWLRIGFGVLALIALFRILGPWFDRSVPWVFFLLGAQYLILGGMEAAGKAGLGEALTLRSVDKWLDLHASRDPVSNGALFEETSGPRRSLEVLNLRAVFADHNAYWASADDFVPHVACSLAKEAGIDLEQCASGDKERLERARTRRRWRTACLAIARTVVLVSPFFIVGAQGVTVSSRDWQPTEDRPEMPVGLRLQGIATGAAVDMLGAFTPDFVKGWFSASPASFSTAKPVVGAASLILLVLLVRLALSLVVWRWRVWDKADATRLFQRKDSGILEPQFVIFLFVFILVAEAMAFAVGGWIAQLRVASTDLLGLMMLGPVMVAFVAFVPWFFKGLWSFFFSDLAGFLGVLKRGASAYTLAFLMALPSFVAAAAHLAGHEPTTIGNSDLVEYAPWLLFSMVGAIWFVPLFGLWRRLEPLVAARLAVDRLTVPHAENTVV